MNTPDQLDAQALRGFKVLSDQMKLDAQALRGFDQALRGFKVLSDQMKLDDEALRGFKVLSDQMKFSDEALRGFKVLSDQMKFSDEALRGFKVLSDQMKFSDEALRGFKVLSDQMKFDDEALRGFKVLSDQMKFSDEALRGFKVLSDQMKFSDEALRGFKVLSDQMKLEGPGVVADSVEDSAPTLPSTDWEDVPDSVLEFEAAEMLVDLRTWIDLWVLLARLRDTGDGGLDAELLVVARQIDECLSGLERTAGPGGVCWGCDDATLRPYGVVCGECAALVAQMMLEAQFLGEGLSGPS